MRAVPRLSSWGGAFERATTTRLTGTSAGASGRPSSMAWRLLVVWQAGTYQWGKGDWAAAVVCAAVPARCGAGVMGAPNQTPAPCRPQKRGGAMTGRVSCRRGDAVLPGDIARLNDRLGPGARFVVNTVPPQCGSTTRSDRDGAPVVPRALGAGRHASGVLELTTVRGSPVRASHPVTMGAPRRRVLHSLAACLAECAMSLGIGTGVYRTGAAGVASLRDGRGTGAPAAGESA